MQLTEEDKKDIYAAYCIWCDKVADDLDNKTWFTAEELVGKVLEIAEEYMNKNIAKLSEV
jgi:hypothetical protein